MNIQELKTYLELKLAECRSIVESYTASPQVITGAMARHNAYLDILKKIS